MATSKQVYRVADLALQFILNSISDRLDKMEGWRGDPEFQADVNLNDNKLTHVGAGSDDSDGARRDELLGSSPTFTSVTMGTAVINSSGVMTAGTVPLARMQRTEVSSKNSGIVTVDSSGTSSITTINLGTVVSGDRIEVFGTAAFAKGVVPGESFPFVLKSAGTATIAVGSDLTQLTGQDVDQASGTTRSVFVSGIIKVTGSGTLTLALMGFSAGSDSTVAANGGQLYGLVLIGS